MCSPSMQSGCKPITRLGDDDAKLRDRADHGQRLSTWPVQRKRPASTVSAIHRDRDFIEIDQQRSRDFLMSRSECNCESPKLTFRFMKTSSSTGASTSQRRATNRATNRVAITASNCDTSVAFVGLNFPCVDELEYVWGLRDAMMLQLELTTK